MPHLADKACRSLCLCNGVNYPKSRGHAARTRMTSGAKRMVAGLTMRWKAFSAASCPEPTAGIAQPGLRPVIEDSFCLSGRCPHASVFQSSPREIFTQTWLHLGSRWMRTWHRHIDSVAFSLAMASLIDMAAPRPHRLLMHVDVEHGIILVKQILHTGQALMGCCLREVMACPPGQLVSVCLSCH